MQHLLLGITLGLATLVPPGPIALTLIGIAGRHGTRPALHGAAGVAGGDLVGGSLAFAVVAAGTTLPAGVFAAGQVLAIVVLVGFGLAVLVRPSAADVAVGRIRHPARALFAVTALAPHALASWIALFVAMPFAGDPRSLAWFAAGIVLASAVWHPILAIGSATLGARSGAHVRTTITRVAGVAMIGMGGAAGWALA